PPTSPSGSTPCWGTRSGPVTWAGPAGHAPSGTSPGPRSPAAPWSSTPRSECDSGLILGLVGPAERDHPERQEAEMSHPLGVSRPDLEVTDLPTPEEVFKVPRIGAKELFKFAVGPSLIALGISIGSGEWLLGPLSVGQYGFVGVGWVILVSAVLQTFYNVECARYVTATGETPVVGWGRVPPGWKLWLPISVFVVIFAFIAGARAD